MEWEMASLFLFLFALPLSLASLLLPVAADTDEV